MIKTSVVLPLWYTEQPLEMAQRHKLSSKLRFRVVCE